jgi:hypothetical protein
MCTVLLSPGVNPIVVNGIYQIISYHIISYHILSYHILSYHIISYHIISYHIISYHIISYHTMCTMRMALGTACMIMTAFGNGTQWPNITLRSQVMCCVILVTELCAETALQDIVICLTPFNVYFSLFAVSDGSPCWWLYCLDEYHTRLVCLWRGTLFCQQFKGLLSCRCLMAFLVNR